MMKKSRLRTVLMLIVISLAAIVSAGKFVRALATIQYWESDDTEIGMWLETPTIVSTQLEDPFVYYHFASYYSSAYNSARTAWQNAGIQTITSFGSVSNADIACYGGRRVSILGATGVAVDPAYAGLTTYPAPTYSSTVIWGSWLRIINTMNPQVKVLIPYRDAVDQNGYKNVFTHELGHALGWLGHSPYSQDVMYYQENGIFTLTYRDKRHLNQIY